jgi:N-acyl-L-homoserine lactone synthetase
VWEASRFCTAPGIRGHHRRHALLWEIICGVIETGLLYGINEVIFAASSALLPLALHCGWEARMLGPRLPGDDDEVVAVAAAITTVGLREMRQRHGIPILVTRFQAIAPPSFDSVEGQPGRLQHFRRSGSRPLHSALRHLWQGNRSSPAASPHG